MMKKEFLFLSILLILHFASFAQWEQIKLSNVAGAVSDIQFINKDIGFCVSVDGLIKTTDAGTTWKLINNSPRGNSVFFANSLFGYIASTNTVFKSIDAGNTWNEIHSTKNESIGDIYFTSPSVGYLITSIIQSPPTSYIYKTLDAGITWARLDSFNIPTLQSITFINSDTGFVVGYAGNIIKTYNAGATWSLSQIYNVETLFDICFPSKTVGYAAGYSNNSGSEVIKTTDGGNTWQPLATKGTLNHALRTISFCTADTGFAAGDEGRIITTTDGGTTWKNSASPVVRMLVASVFIKPGVGFIGGDNATLLKMNDNIVTGISSLFSSSIHLFPNPATNSVTIEGDLDKKVTLSLRNISGQEILNKNIEFSKSYKLDFHNINNGVYFLTISDGQQQLVKKIIIQN